MKEGDEINQDNSTLQVRLSGLTEAILRISEDLDLDTVLQQIIDSARSLTEARYGALVTSDPSKGFQDILTSGMSAEEERLMYDFAEGPALFQYLSGINGTLRTQSLVSHLGSAGFEGLRPQIGNFLGTQIRDGDKHIGNIYLGKKEGEGGFSQDDEKILEMFANQAALAINNARRYREERQAKADLEALVNTSPVAVIVFDARTREVTKFNREAHRIIAGGSGQENAFEELLKLTDFRRMDGREITLEESPLERAIRGETARAEEVVIHSPNREAVSTLLNVSPIRSEDGEIVSVVVTLQDITPLDELERLRAEFLGMVSHELRAPLTSIKGSAATALNSPSPLDPAETQQFFRIIESQADHMRDLINNLLDLTRIEAGTLSVVLDQTDIASVIEQAKTTFQSGGYRNSIDVDTDPDLPRIGADAMRIAQVLHNLFVNASKYSREWSPIRVRAWVEDLHVAVSVTDEGRGIPAEHIPHLFTKFSRADGADQYSKIEGEGLGLAICKGIVEAHGGRIWVENERAGRGTRFVFTIPVMEEAGFVKGVGAYPGSEALDPQLGRILTIDDDPQILRYVRHTLSSAGYESIMTDNPEEVEQILLREEPQLVLLNLVLPKTNGFEVLERIHGISEIPVIFISGRGRDQDIEKAFDMGASDYVVKPFSPTELLVRIRASLRNQAAVQQAQHPEPLVLGDLTIDYGERSVAVSGQEVQLTPTEYRLLCELSLNHGRVVPYDQLSRRIWGHGSPVNTRLLRSFVKDLRHKIGDDAKSPAYIFTESGTGYRFISA